MDNEIYFTKEVKKWGDSLIMKFHPEDIKILNLEKGDTVEGRISIKKKKEVNTMQEQETEGAHLEEGEEFDEDEESEEKEDDFD